MDAEIVFTGLCSFLNVDGKNRTMGDPSVILVKTDHGHGGGQPHDEHIAFLAFNTDKVEVDDPTGFTAVKKASKYMYLGLDGVELSIANDPPGTPAVDSSYRDLVVKKDDYWPEEKDKWDPDFVAPKGKKPKKSAVKAFMRFGKGTVSAARVCEVPWRFIKKNGDVFERKFAEEVIYSDFPHSESAVEITLTDLSNGEPNPASRKLRFSLKSGAKTLTLYVGNNLEKDIPQCLFREKTKYIGAKTDHFKYLNRIAGKDNGPIPEPVNPPGGGAGGSGGICGPGNGNGG